MLVMKKNSLAEHKNFQKKIQKFYKNFQMKKSSTEQKNFRPRIFSFVKYLSLFQKNESSKQ